MKIEYIPDGSIDCPVLRLFHFDESEAAQLRALCLEMAAGKTENHVEYDVVNADSALVGRLFLRLTGEDHGLVKLNEADYYEWRLTANGWTKAADLIEPFCYRAEPGFYQWLDEYSELSLLLSASGEW